jgi:hypothetical protein
MVIVYSLAAFLFSVGGLLSATRQSVAEFFAVIMFASGTCVVVSVLIETVV